VTQSSSETKEHWRVTNSLLCIVCKQFDFIIHHTLYGGRIFINTKSQEVL